MCINEIKFKTSSNIDNKLYCTYTPSHQLYHNYKINNRQLKLENHHNLNSKSQIHDELLTVNARIAYKGQTSVQWT